MNADEKGKAMTLDLEKFISNSIKTQAKIQHLDVSTKTRKVVPESVKEMITREYGENYLADADYVSFFWGEIGREQVKKLFNVVDKALGKSANKLTETDFKKINFNDASIEDSTDAKKEDASEELSGESPTSNEEIDVEVGEQLDEDSNDVVLPSHENYFFLKITLK